MKRSSNTACDRNEQKKNKIVAEKDFEEKNKSIIECKTNNFEEFIIKEELCDDIEDINKDIEDRLELKEDFEEIQIKESHIVSDAEATNNLPSNPQKQIEFKWNTNETKYLIDLYEEYRENVGTHEIRNIKQMWQKIADKLSKTFHTNIFANNCENRWRVLERNYKKYISNNNSTRRRRKYFEFADDMDRLFNCKKSVHPELILSSDTVNVPNDVEVKDMENINEEVNENVMKITFEKENEIVKKTIISRDNLKSNVRKRKNSLIETIRQDKLQYQKKRLQIEMEKLHEIKRRNDLTKERNDILRQKCCKCTCSALNI